MLAEKILDYHWNLSSELPMPEGIEILYPYSAPGTRAAMRQFYEKYYSDSNPRYVILGINPGRFGAGVTGIPFTDPVALSEKCGIENSFLKRKELSSIFIYELIDAMGGLTNFYRRFYISSVFPLGFTRAGKNFNYYDSKELMKGLHHYIVQHLRTQLALPLRNNIAFCLGKGKNFTYLSSINRRYAFFTKLIPLPHPRWIMQYRRKSKSEQLKLCVDALSITNHTEH